MLVDQRAGNPWLVFPIPRPQALVRLFCFPFAGGGAAAYRTWPEHLLPAIEVCGVELPGHGLRLRESLFTDLCPLVEAVGEAIMPVIDKPFAFYGHSMGALISFELARRLRRQLNLGPVRLFVAGRRAPQMADSTPPIHDLPDREFVAHLRALNGSPEAVLQDAEIMRLLLPMLRADLAICETYRYTSDEPLQCPISAFGGLEDRQTSYEDLANWRVQTDRTVVLRMLPGDHFFPRTAQSLLLPAITQDLGRDFDRMIGRPIRPGPVD
jgi:medium-chain acyl-[acyl-carrier-protein] hydrolase